MTWSNPLLKQGHLQRVARGCAQLHFESLQPWSLCNLFGKPVFDHPPSNDVFFLCEGRRGVGKQDARVEHGGALHGLNG